MDVHDKLDELAARVEGARSMPMSASCIVNRAEVLGLLDELRELLPQELDQARGLLADREAVVDDGRAEARRIIEDAHAEQARLVSESVVVAEAVRQADEIGRATAEETARMRRETDDYVDEKLANFEVVLTKTLAAVHRGREKLHGRSELDALGEVGADVDEPPLPPE